MMTISPAADALQRNRALRRLAGGVRSAGVSMPWLTALRTRCRTGIHHPLDQELVDLGVLPAEHDVDLAAGLAREVADHERHAAEDLADRHQPDAHHAFAQLAQLPLDALGVLLDRAPLGAAARAARCARASREARAQDDEIADHPHQLVEPRSRRARSAATTASPTAGSIARSRRYSARGRRRPTAASQRRARQAVGGARRRPARSDAPANDESNATGPASRDQRRGVDDLAGLAQPRADAIDVDAAGDQCRRRREHALPVDAWLARLRAAAAPAERRRRRARPARAARRASRSMSGAGRLRGARRSTASSALAPSISSVHAAARSGARRLRATRADSFPARAPAASLSR